MMPVNARRHQLLEMTHVSLQLLSIVPQCFAWLFKLHVHDETFVNICDYFEIFFHIPRFLIL